MIRSPKSQQGVFHVKVAAALVVSTAMMAFLFAAGDRKIPREQSGAADELPIRGSALCQSPAQFAQSRLLQLASAKTEVTPFSRRAIDASEAYLQSEPPLWENLGAVTYAVTTTSEMAQRYFDQGLRLAYGFNHAEARRSFRKAQALDPGCALCYWGEALVLGPNINWPMESEANAPALAALTKAQALADGASPREQALIEALSARYTVDTSVTRATLDIAYADAMAKVARQYPDDRDIGVLYAEAMMNLSPWDYWRPGGREPKGRTAEIVSVLERVLNADPDHPGAIHYYIHMVEASDRPARAEPYADRLARAMPGAGHLVHMPSHIYYRVGRYADSLAANKQAVAADESYFAQARPVGLYPQAYYPHNIHFLLASAQMAGDGRTVIEAAEKLERSVTAEAARNIPWVQPIKAAPFFAHAQFSPSANVLALADPGDELPYVKAMWHYARGVAFAAQMDTAAARREAAAIAALDRSADFTSLTLAGIPASEVLRLAREVVLARVAQADGDDASAIARLEAAVSIEEGLPYMEPPYWYHPMRQSLGAALLRAGRLDAAEAQFRASLQRTPSNGWSHFGLAEVHKARGDATAANEAERHLARTWVGDRDLLTLSRL